MAGPDHSYEISGRYVQLENGRDSRSALRESPDAPANAPVPAGEGLADRPSRDGQWPGSRRNRRRSALLALTHWLTTIGIVLHIGSLGRRRESLPGKSTACSAPIAGSHHGTIGCKAPR